MLLEFVAKPILLYNQNMYLMQYNMFKLNETSSSMCQFFIDSYLQYLALKT
jgi:hypothetical protein